MFILDNSSCYHQVRIFSCTTSIRLFSSETAAFHLLYRWIKDCLFTNKRKGGGTSGIVSKCPRITQVCMCSQFIINCPLCGHYFQQLYKLGTKRQSEITRKVWSLVIGNTLIIVAHNIQKIIIGLYTLTRSTFDDQVTIPSYQLSYNCSVWTLHGIGNPRRYISWDI